MKISSRSLLVGFLVCCATACGGKTTEIYQPFDATIPGRFLFDCVAYEVGCPPVDTVGDTSQEQMPTSFAVDSVFLTSFVPDDPHDNGYVMSMVPGSRTLLADATYSGYPSPQFSGVDGIFRAAAPGSAEIDVVNPFGELISRTAVNLVQATRLAFRHSSGEDVIMPLQMVPMGQICLYAVPLSETGETLAGLPSCTSTASNGDVQVSPYEAPGVICINGEMYGSATVSVTCGKVTSSFSVVLAHPPIDDAGAADATVDGGDGSDGSDAADAHPCITSCGDSSCVDTNDDPANCGACGAVCDGTCQRGRCIVTVATGQDSPFAIASDGTNVYWTNGSDNSPGTGSVMRAPVGGGAPSVVAAPQDRPKFIVVDATRAYWTTTTAVMSVPLDGGVATPIVAAQGRPYGIAVDSTNLYWTNEGSGELMKMALAGGSPLALTPSVVGLNPQQLVIDDTRAYWFNFASDTILTIPLSGGSVTTFYYDYNFYLAGLGIDRQAVYYTERSSGGPVMACPRDGGTPHEIASDNGTEVVVSDGLNVYFTSPDGNAPDFDGEVIRVPLDGGAPETLATGGTPMAIAVDATNVYWTSPSTRTVLRTAK